MTELNRIRMSVLAQRCTDTESLKRLVSEHGWDLALFEDLHRERFGTIVTSVDFFEEYLNGLLVGGWSSVDHLRSNVEQCFTHLVRRTDASTNSQRPGYGLVVGRIQSGKTAHMLGLAAKCFTPNRTEDWHQRDLVIVLSGLIEDLRIQTLSRGKNAGFRGVTVFPENDFKPSNDIAKSALRSVLDAPPGLMIIKKNHVILETLVECLNDPDIHHKLVQRRVVVIDDEADHASIDSGHAESGQADEITRTNRAVRSLLQALMCGASSPWYIGYTATPYSNLLMEADPAERSSVFGHSLFPRDFIYCVHPQPEGHFDNETIFHRDSAQAINPIDLADNDIVGEERVIRTIVLLHVLSRVYRQSQVSGPFHHSSMIHQSLAVEDHTVACETVQRVITDACSQSLDLLKIEAIHVAEKFYPDLVAEFAILIDGETDLGVSVLYRELQRIEVIKLNSDVPTTSDINQTQYPSDLNYPEGGNKSVIVVGGTKLSRGLTLEGLTISWLCRQSSTPKYDTLLQMARWCGFRTGYENLVRILMPTPLIEAYTLITDVEMRLRNDLIEIGTSSAPLQETHWIREYRGMEVSGRIPDSVRRRSPDSTLLPSVYHTRSLAEDFLIQTAKEIQEQRFDEYQFLISQLPEDLIEKNSYSIAKDIDSSIIQNFLFAYLQQYISGSREEQQLYAIVNAIDEHLDLTWNVAFTSSLPTSKGARRAGQFYLRFGSLDPSIIDLDHEWDIRTNPLLMLNVESPDSKIAGVPVYQDNGIPIVVSSIFIPMSMEPSGFEELARPMEEE